MKKENNYKITLTNENNEVILKVTSKVSAEKCLRNYDKRIKDDSGNIYANYYYATEHYYINDKEYDRWFF